MKRFLLILKICIFYIIGFISFSTIAYITQTILISILLDITINPTQDLYNLSNIIKTYFIYYFVAYTILHCLIVFAVSKYDRYIVNKLNEKLEKLKGENKNGKR